MTVQKVIGFILAAYLVLGTMGCSKDDKDTTAKDFKQEVTETMGSVADTARDTKNEYVDAMKKKLSDLDKKIDRLQTEFSTKAQDWSEESRDAANQMMEKLKEQRDAAGKQLKELEDETGDAWDKTKENIDTAMKNLGDAYESTKKKISSMISAVTK